MLRERDLRFSYLTILFTTVYWLSCRISNAPGDAKLFLHHSLLPSLPYQQSRRMMQQNFYISFIKILLSCQLLLLRLQQQVNGFIYYFPRGRKLKKKKRCFFLQTIFTSNNQISCSGRSRLVDNNSNIKFTKLPFKKKNPI